MLEKMIRGRKEGWKKTTKEEDRTVMQTFKKLRPDGHGVDSRVIHKALPKKLKKKVSRRLVIRRLAAKGYRPERKISKSDPGIQLAKRRVKFCKLRQDWTPDDWETEVQGAGDFREFAYYPKELKGKHKKLRAPWTYMTKAEKQKPAFVRPKRWFPKKQWKKVKKQKVFGLTTSNGKSLCFLVPPGYTTEKWAGDVRKRVGPFLKRSFPSLSSFQILLDGEPLLHGPAAKAAFKAWNIKCLPGWPKYSPDLNPQENVWSWSEDELRRQEADRDSFSDFQRKVLSCVNAYPEASKKKLVRSMTKRCQLCIDKQGAMIKY